MLLTYPRNAQSSFAPRMSMEKPSFMQYQDVSQQQPFVSAPPIMQSAQVHQPLELYTLPFPSAVCVSCKSLLGTRDYIKFELLHPTSGIIQAELCSLRCSKNYMKRIGADIINIRKQTTGTNWRRTGALGIAKNFNIPFGGLPAQKAINMLHLKYCCHCNNDVLATYPEEGILATEIRNRNPRFMLVCGTKCMVMQCTAILDKDGELRDSCKSRETYSSRQDSWRSSYSRQRSHSRGRTAERENPRREEKQSKKSRSPSIRSRSPRSRSPQERSRSPQQRSPVRNRSKSRSASPAFRDEPHPASRSPSPAREDAQDDGVEASKEDATEKKEEKEEEQHGDDKSRKMVEYEDIQDSQQSFVTKGNILQDFQAHQQLMDSKPQMFAMNKKTTSPQKSAQQTPAASHVDSSMQYKGQMEEILGKECHF